MGQQSPRAAARQALKCFLQQLFVLASSRMNAMQEEETPQQIQTPPAELPKDILAEPADPDYQESDVFAWANNLFEYKEELALEVFWINKNNVVYRTRLDPLLSKNLQEL